LTRVPSMLLPLCFAAHRRANQRLPFSRYRSVLAMSAARSSALTLWAFLGALTACTRERPHPPANQLGAQDPYHTPPTDTLESATYDGWKQYRLYCDRCHGEEAGGTSFGPNLLTALRPDGSIPSRGAFVALLVTGRPDRGMPTAATLGVDPKYFDGLYDYLQGRSAGRFLGGRPARRSS
jgi:mono/diheme cytochrome c family protein